ncbi:hypothetical protein [Kitasatospora azatica]|uniref:hypothetical protein n=1 Tax=Kitasatospora azatica TaxID=58347 RepID=UPI0005633EE4|nr:hypothetical protein [Kitasatospora azatica]
MVSPGIENLPADFVPVLGYLPGGLASARSDTRWAYQEPGQGAQAEPLRGRGGLRGATLMLRSEPCDRVEGREPAGWRPWLLNGTTKGWPKMMVDRDTEFDLEALQLLPEELAAEQVWCRLTCNHTICDHSKILD